MRELRIAYRRFGIRHEIIRRVPQKWEELTPAQFLLVSRLYLQEIDEPSFLKEFYSLPYGVGSDTYYSYKLSELVEFISDCRVRMDRFILPAVSGLKAPGDRLKGMCFEHFMHVDTAFNRYVRDGKDASLDTFVAMLYLKDNEYIVLPSGGKNGLFSRQKPLILQKRIMKVTKIDRHVKYAIFLNYVFVKRWLSKAFPFLFPLDDEPEEKRNSPAAPSVNWLDIFDAFVGDDVAVMEKYQAMPVATAFRLLNKGYVTPKNRRNDFSEYIENLAERHVDIRHKENDEVHFLSSEREKHTALDSVLHYPAVIVDRGSGFGYGGNPGAYRKDRDYLLFIVEHVSDTSDYEQIEAALDKCERILDELLNQILEDKRKKRLWLAFSLEDVEADYVVNNDNQLYGVVAAIHLSELYKVLNCRNAFL